LCLVVVDVLRAGPPFVTDDPEPVEFRHWEVYVASVLNYASGDWSGTLPHLEINYGGVPNLQLHFLAPLAFNFARSGPSFFGYGDTELGAKYRFLEQGKITPDVAVFPAMEVPTGNESRGLGAGHVQLFLPVWLQKDFGKWTINAGGGFWINPGASNQNWEIAGMLLQRQLTDHLTLGAEIFHQTPKTVGGDANTFINGGGIWDLSDQAHILFSIGHTVQGPSNYIGYFGILFTFGPKDSEKKYGR
jgi:hypothetical protein